MPAMEAKLICRLAPAIESGFLSSSAARTTESEVSASSSRLNSGADSRHMCMNAALVTEGVKPVMAAKNASSGNPARTAARRRPSSRKKNPIRQEICMPDTATTWASPASHSI